MISNSNGIKYMIIFINTIYQIEHKSQVDFSFESLESLEDMKGNFNTYL